MIRGKRGQGGLSWETLVGALIAVAIVALIFVFLFDIGGVRSKLMGYTGTEPKDAVQSHCSSYIGSSLETYCCKVHYLQQADKTVKSMSCYTGKRDGLLDIGDSACDYNTQCTQYICPADSVVSVKQKCAEDNVIDKKSGFRFYYDSDGVIQAIPYKEYCCVPKAVAVCASPNVLCATNQQCPQDKLVSTSTSGICCSVACS